MWYIRFWRYMVPAWNKPRGKCHQECRPTIHGRYHFTKKTVAGWLIGIGLAKKVEFVIYQKSLITHFFNQELQERTKTKRRIILFSIIWIRSHFWFESKSQLALMKPWIHSASSRTPVSEQQASPILYERSDSEPSPCLSRAIFCV